MKADATDPEDRLLFRAGLSTQSARVALRNGKPRRAKLLLQHADELIAYAKQARRARIVSELTFDIQPA